jgi:hypothetical protein
MQELSNIFVKLFLKFKNPVKGATHLKSQVHAVVPVIVESIEINFTSGICKHL